MKPIHIPLEALRSGLLNREEPTSYIQVRARNQRNTSEHARKARLISHRISSYTVCLSASASFDITRGLDHEISRDYSTRGGLRRIRLQTPSREAILQRYTAIQPPQRNDITAF